MSDRGATARLQERAALAGVDLPAGTARRLGDYLALLARWNERINLTALDAAGLSDEAIDVLAIEPLIAARLIHRTDRTLLDVGSGSGSPAIPMKLAAPQLELVMVEARARKAAFLSEAVRHLDLFSTTVENCRVEDLAARELVRTADVVTVRAVRLDEGLGAALARLMSPTGRAILFRSKDQESIESTPELSVTSETSTLGGRKLVILEKKGIAPGFTSREP